VVGGWSSWGPMSCSGNSSEFQTRQRTCSNPRPQYNGRCDGATSSGVAMETEISEMPCGNRPTNCSSTESGCQPPTVVCRPGFTGSGTDCTDIDECQLNDGGCHENATCINTPGSFTCTCKPGFSGNGINCTPANNGDCSLTAAGCRPPTVVCRPGFTGTGGANCTDIDECQVNNGGCHENATCTNTPGSFTCTCKPGFRGNGIECTPASTDKCQVNNGGCGDNATCTSTSGSVQCTCNSGYKNNGNGNRCVPTGAGH